MIEKFYHCDILYEYDTFRFKLTCIQNLCHVKVKFIILCLYI